MYIEKGVYIYGMEKTPRTRSNIHLSKQEKEIGRRIAREKFGTDDWSKGARYALHIQDGKDENEAKEAAK